MFRKIADNKGNQGKLNSMNEKVFETRQIIGAAAAPKASSVPKVSNQLFRKTYTEG